jgi:hypothetical protein
MSIPERAALAVFGEQTVWCLLQQYSKIRRAPQETVFFCSGGILFMQSITRVLISFCFAHFISRRAKSNTNGAKTALQEILLLEEIQG